MATLPPPTGNMTILDRVAQYEAFDRERILELQYIASEYERIKAYAIELKADLDDERTTRRDWRQRAEAAESAINRSQFALVLIDGDGYRFSRETLAAAGESGGAQAAHRLRTEVLNYLASRGTQNENLQNMDVMVNIYANKSGLAKVLSETGVIQTPSQLDQFFHSFSQSHSLFQFIDCGPGKERADAKLRDTYRFYAYNSHCRYIFLGCCHDNGYVAELDKYRHDPVAAVKTLLIEHNVSGMQYANLPFPTISLGSILETTPLTPIKKAVRQNIGTTVPAPVQPQPTAQQPSPQVRSYTSPEASAVAAATKALDLRDTPVKLRVVPQSISYASATKIEQKKPKDSDARSESTPSVDLNPLARGIPVNRDGERIDKSIDSPPTADLLRFRARSEKKKICNSHHLTGSCPKSYCPFDHMPLDKALKLVLRYKARAIPCNQAGACRKFNCFLGHHCPWGNPCGEKGCRWEKEGYTDKVDMKVVTFEDPE